MEAPKALGTTAPEKDVLGWVDEAGCKRLSITYLGCSLSGGDDGSSESAASKRDGELLSETLLPPEVSISLVRMAQTIGEFEDLGEGRYPPERCKSLLSLRIMESYHLAPSESAWLES